MNFSTDKAQSCLYVGDNANMTIYILNRSNLQELGRLGRSGRMAGEFHWLHQVSVDSKGNIYTAEVDTGKRIQKFLRYGANRLQRNRIGDRRRTHEVVPSAFCGSRQGTTNQLLVDRMLRAHRARAPRNRRVANLHGVCDFVRAAFEPVRFRASDR